MKKSYNPFKMKGSYIAGILVAIILGFVGFAFSSLCGFDGSCSLGLTFSYILSGGLVGFTIGFILGWAINSLIIFIDSKL